MANGRRVASGSADSSSRDRRPNETAQGKTQGRRFRLFTGSRNAERSDASSVKPRVDRPRNRPNGNPRNGQAVGYTGIRALFNPIWCYHGFLVAVLVLCCFGVIMVFSSSSVSLVSAGKSPWNRAISQGVYCGVGLVCAVLLSRVKVEHYLKFCSAAMICALIGQLLTLTPLGTGEAETGNNGWIVLGPISLQPAEFTKLALCIWLPFALRKSAKQYARDGIKAYLMPGIIYCAALGLIMLGKDLGTGLIIVFIGITAFMIGGFPLKWMAGLIGGLGALVLALVITSPNRMGRILAAYKPCTDLEGVCYQSMHAKYALAEGGLLGVGLGNSREKWNYLPAAHTDFIYAIIGEETGFVGALTVLLLFIVIGWCLMCVALQIRERYVSMVLVCITVWLVGQALVNIGVVIGIFPVLGVPMPFVSSGGSSMITCLMAAGAVAGLMRSQPQINAEHAGM